MKAKAQKAQITRNRLGPAAANQWKKKLKTLKSSEIDYGDPCTQKLKKLESLEIDGDRPPAANQWKIKRKNFKPSEIQESWARIGHSKIWFKNPNYQKYNVAKNWAPRINAKNQKVQIIRNNANTTPN